MPGMDAQGVGGSEDEKEKQEHKEFFFNLFYDLFSLKPKTQLQDLDNGSVFSSEGFM